MSDALRQRQPRWEDRYDPSLIDAVGRLSYDHKYGVTAFLEWLANCDRNSSPGRVCRYFTSDLDPREEGLFVDALSHERAFIDALNEWKNEYVATPSGVSQGTRQGRLHAARKGLELLSRQGAFGIPENFKGRWFKAGTPVTGSFPSLGAAQWPELSGLSGIDREQRALEMVRAEFASYFLLHERLFRFGQDVLGGEATPSNTDEGAREVVRQALRIYQAKLYETGTTSIGRHEALMEKLQRPETWLRAGGPEIGRLRNELGSGHIACLGCLGPITGGMISALGLLLCDTGWNVQPMRDLASNPFAFRSATSAYLAEKSFISSFKNRAGHAVLAYLGERDLVPDGAMSTVLEPWKQTVQSHDPNREKDGYAVLVNSQAANHLSAVAVIDSYRHMADTLRGSLPTGTVAILSDSFWLFMNKHGVRDYAFPSRPVQLDHVFPASAICRRKGFSFKAIRKTVLLLRRRDAISIGEVRASAGHTSSRILMPHYLNTPPINAELDESIRRFQDALEAIVVRTLDQDDVAFRLGKEVRDLERLRQAADAAGITTALGLRSGTDNLSNEPSRLEFRPSDGRLGELYLIHRKLRLMQAGYRNRDRFRKEFLPMLALAKAIGRAIFQSGLGPRYWRAAREASIVLREGSIVLPSLED